MNFQTVRDTWVRKGSHRNTDVNQFLGLSTVRLYENIATHGSFSRRLEAHSGLVGLPEDHPKSQPARYEIILWRNRFHIPNSWLTDDLLNIYCWKVCLPPCVCLCNYMSSFMEPLCTKPNKRLWLEPKVVLKVIATRGESSGRPHSVLGQVSWRQRKRDNSSSIGAGRAWWDAHVRTARHPSILEIRLVYVAIHNPFKNTAVPLATVKTNCHWEF